MPNPLISEFPNKRDTLENNRIRKNDDTFQRNKESEPRRSKREKIAKPFDPDYIWFMIENEPLPLKEAMASLKSSLWKEL